MVLISNSCHAQVLKHEPDSGGDARRSAFENSPRKWSGAPYSGASCPSRLDSWPPRRSSWTRATSNTSRPYGLKSMSNIYIYGTALGSPTPPPPGMVMVPCPAPYWSGWGGCGWVGMLVDGVVVFANDVESYGICMELYLVRERRQTWKAHSLMMGL